MDNNTQKKSPVKIQTVFRDDGEDRSYTKLSNALLQHPTIADDTLGMLCRLMSRPRDWEISIEGLIASGKSGKARVRRQVEEARLLGFMARHVERDSKGKVLKYVYMVSDNPKKLTVPGPLSENQEVDAHPLSDYQEAGQQEVGNQPQQRKDLNKGKIEQIINPLTPLQGELEAGGVFLDEQKGLVEARQDNPVFHGNGAEEVPLPAKKKAARKTSVATPLPEGWAPSEELIAGEMEKYAITRRMVEFVAYGQFVPWWQGSGGLKKDWNATFRTWMGKAASDGIKVPAGYHAPSDPPRTNTENPGIAAVAETVKEADGMRIRDDRVEFDEQLEASLSRICRGQIDDLKEVVRIAAKKFRIHKIRENIEALAERCLVARTPAIAIAQVMGV